MFEDTSTLRDLVERGAGNVAGALDHARKRIGETIEEYQRPAIGEQTGGQIRSNTGEVIFGLGIDSDPLAESSDDDDDDSSFKPPPSLSEREIKTSDRVFDIERKLAIERAKAGNEERRLYEVKVGNSGRDFEQVTKEG